MENRKEHGYFEKGTEIGKDTRFKPNNTLSQKYSEEYPDKLIEYYTDCYNQGKRPSLVGFALSVGIKAPQTPLNWINPNSEFFHARFGEAYAHVRVLEEEYWISTGIDCKNAGFVQFMLKNKFGYEDKASVDTSMKVKAEPDWSAFSAEELRKLAKIDDGTSC